MTLQADMLAYHMSRVLTQAQATAIEELRKQEECWYELTLYPPRFNGADATVVGEGGPYGGETWHIDSDGNVQRVTSW